MRFVFISDTHNRHREVFVPDGDVLVHCGDATLSGSAFEILEFLQWFHMQPHAHKILIPGNHDWLYEKSPGYAAHLLERFGSITFLLDSGKRIDDVYIWGSPWSPEFNDWAFNLPRGGPELAAKWAAIPDRVDVLVTHCPPKGILDTTTPAGVNLGCERLMDRVRQLPRLRLHAFGHIHPSHGELRSGEITFVNASIVNAINLAAYVPIVIDL